MRRSGSPQRAAPVRFAWVARTARLLVVLLLAWVLVPVTADQGRAFATGTVQAKGFGVRNNQGGATYAASAYPAPSSASQGSQILGLISLGASSSTATADPLADTAAATADAGTLNIKAPITGTSVIGLGDAHAQCTAGPTGVTGTAQAGGLTVLGVAVGGVPAGNIPPNTSVGLSVGGSITFNQQVVTNSGGEYTISVIGAHIVSGSTDLELARVECGSTVPSAPVVTAVSPSQGPSGGGSTVTITGTNFLAVSSVRFGSTNATTYTVNSSTSITATAPAGTGTVDVRVVNPAGTSAVAAADLFTYLSKPVVTGISPAAGPTAGGTSVVITGTDLAGATSVKFGSANATGLSANTATSVTVVAPAAAAGAVDVTVTTAGGTSDLVSADRYTYTAAPTVTGVAPGSGPTSPGSSVVVTGTNLTGATAVSFGAANAVSYTVDSDTRITAVAPAGSAGTVDVTVTTAGGTSAVSSADRYTYVVVAPTVTGLSPAAGSSEGGTTVTITGTNLTGASEVWFGATAATGFSVDSDTRIVAVAPAHAPGPVDVTVVTTYGTSVIGTVFDYTADPVVAALAPDSGPTTGAWVVITGSGFTGAVAVRFGTDPAASFTVDSDTQITATAPPRPAGSVHVRVDGPFATSAITAAGEFEYVAGPVITSLTPAVGPLSGGGTVTVIGTGLTPTASVEFGGNPSPAVTFVSSTEIDAVVPAGASGPVDVVVSTDYGQDTRSDGYEYRPAPTVTSLTPWIGPQAGGTVVDLTGTGFTDVTDVRFGGTPALTFTVTDDTRISATAPAGTGEVDVLVTGPGGTSAGVPASTYRYAPVPVLAAVTPGSGPTVGGSPLTLTGSGFTGADAVTMDGVALAFTVLDDTTITLLTPGGTGDVPVLVSTPGGSSLPLTFEYANGPTISGISPNAGANAGGGVVVVTGTGFTTASSVDIDGVPAVVHHVDSTRLDVTTPASSTTGPVLLTVSTAHGTDQITFRYVARPTVDALLPVAGPLAGTTVTITGSGFDDVDAVLFGADPATSFTVDDDTSITAVAPPGSAGTVDVTVSGIGGSSAISSDDRFQYLAPPSISALTPVAGPVGGGTLVIITGSGFTADATVTFGAIASSAVAFVDPTRLEASSPVAPVAGPVPVLVSTPGGADGAVFTYRDNPVVTATAPQVGPEAGGTTVTVTGIDLDGTTDVVFGSTPAGFTVDSATRITATAPAGSGTVDVRVSGPGGTSNPVPAGRFRYAPVPVAATLSPAVGPVAGGTALTITGSGLTGTTSVTVGASPAAFTVVDDATVTLSLPAGPAGAADVVVSTPGGVGAPLSFLYAGVPAVDALTPAAGPVAGGTDVTVTGSGFTPDSTVDFGGTAAAVVYVDDTELVATSPVRSGPAVVDVRVVSPYGSSATAGPGDDFAYTHAPTIASINPAAGPVAGGSPLTLSGAGLGAVTSVSFDGVAAPTFSVLDDATIAVTTPPGTAGDAVVLVAGAGGTGTGTFRYAVAPTLADATPAAGPQSGGTVVTVTGTDLTDAQQVWFGSAPAVFSVEGPTRITATAPAGTGSVDITVTTPGGTSPADPSVRFWYAPVPVLTAATPDSGPLTGGTAVTLTGTGFPAATELTVDGASVPFTAVDGGTLTFLTPPGAPGPVEVVLTGPGGTSVPLPFDYVPPPTISGLSPTAGPLGGGTSVTVTGTGFTPADTVTFSGVPATAVMVTDATELTAISPGAGSAGPLALVVTGPYGSSPGESFDYVAAPVISDISPAAGPLSGGTAVTLTGTGLGGAVALSFGGVPVGSFTVLNDTMITAISPPGAAGPVVVEVSTAGGTGTDEFRYAAVPVIDLVQPGAGPRDGGTSLTITGSGLFDGTVVEFGGVPAIFSVVDDTTITVVTPPGVGSAAVTVTTPGGTSLSPASYDYLPIPVLTGVAPAFGPVDGGTTVTLTGSGLGAADRVTLGGADLTFTVVDDSTISFSTPAGPAGDPDVVVHTPGGQTLPAPFGYRAAPVVDALAPNAGPVGGGGLVTVTGSGFTGASAVGFGAASATGFAVTSDTEILALAPAAGVGPVQVRATAPGGVSAAGTGSVFDYLPAPLIDGLSPGSGPSAVATAITVTGSGFIGVDRVRIDGAAVAFTVVDDTTLTLTAPPAPAGSVPVVVSSAGGAASADFTYLPSAPGPTLVSLSPDEGPPAGGGTVALTGTGLTGANLVRFGVVPATFTVVGDTLITAEVPAGTGTVEVRVSTPTGTTGDQVRYRYLDPQSPPRVDSLTPRVGPMVGGTRVTITGAGFDEGTTVDFGGVPGTDVQVGIPSDAITRAAVPALVAAATSTSSTLTVRSPAHEPGPVEVEVRNSAGRVVAADPFIFVPPIEEATIGVEVEVNTARAVAAQGPLYAGLSVLECAKPRRGSAALGAVAAFCRYFAPARAGRDVFTMRVTDVLGEQATQTVRVRVVDNAAGGEDGGGGSGTGGGGGNDTGGGAGTGGGGNDTAGGSGTGGGGGNDTGGGSGSGGGTGTGDSTGGSGPDGTDRAGGGTGTGAGGGNAGEAGGGRPHSPSPSGDDGTGPSPSAEASPGGEGTGGSGGNNEAGPGSAAAGATNGPHPGGTGLAPALLLGLLLAAGAGGLLLVRRRGRWSWFLIAARRRRESREQPDPSRK